MWSGFTKTVEGHRLSEAGVWFNETGAEVEDKAKPRFGFATNEDGLVKPRVGITNPMEMA